MSLLRVDALRKSYKARTVVREVGFEVGGGEVVGLLGPNGAGKDHLFLHDRRPGGRGRGEISLDGKTITHAPIHSRARLGLSYLPQEMSVFRKLTVAENIQAVLELQGHKGDDLHKRLEALLEELGIEHLRDNPHFRSPAASGDAARLPVRWQPIPNSSCSTNRLPAWIRSRYWTSRRSSASSRKRASAC